MEYDLGIKFGILVGKTLTQITKSNKEEEINFITTEGEHYQLFHSQDCCESVHIDDICGDLNDLVGLPILLAEESSSKENPPNVVIPDTYQDMDSFTWTFYKLSTVKGDITIRWYGSSNGYYSEGVDFVKINIPEAK